MTQEITTNRLKSTIAHLTAELPKKGHGWETPQGEPSNIPVREAAKLIVDLACEIAPTARRQQLKKTASQ